MSSSSFGSSREEDLEQSIHKSAKELYGDDLGREQIQNVVSSEHSLDQQMTEGYQGNNKDDEEASFVADEYAEDEEASKKASASKAASKVEENIKNMSTTIEQISSEVEFVAPVLFSPVSMVPSKQQQKHFVVARQTHRQRLQYHCR